MASDTALADSLAPVQWDLAMGRGMLISTASSPESASVILPGYVENQFSGGTLADVTSLAGSRWDLFGRSGGFGAAQFAQGTIGDSADGCLTWPSGMLSGARSGWKTAFEAGTASAIPLDSVEAMSSPDSARFIIDVTRLVSSTQGPNDSLFASIPFVVRHAYRFRTGEIDGVIGLVQRSIHSEADPREEHSFVIGERPVGSSDPYRVGYITRAAGAEGGVPVTDVLALVMLSKTHRLMVIASHEYEDRGEFWTIQRIVPTRWRALWRSVAAGCS